MQGLGLGSGREDLEVRQGFRPCAAGGVQGLGLGSGREDLGARTCSQPANRGLRAVLSGPCLTRRSRLSSSVAYSTVNANAVQL